MSTRKTIGLLASALVIAVLALGGYWLLQRISPDKCGICKREIHAEARAVIEVDGKREPVCCARCALTLARQQVKPVRLVEVTDYVSRQPLSPEAAYYVEGSQVILCERHEPLLNQTKQPYDRVFDRCVPSVYAFARSEEAAAFATNNGGVVLRLPQLLTESGTQP